MIFAAGLGTRLRPLTDTMPKALVPVGGVPLLEHVILKLRSSGYDSLVVNVHHFPDQIISFLRAKGNFGLDIQVSDERDLLRDTGGGVKFARPLLEGADQKVFWPAPSGPPNPHRLSPEPPIGGTSASGRSLMRLYSHPPQGRQAPAGSAQEPGDFLVHNVDILSNLDLRSIPVFDGAIATLVVSSRETSRYLLFDESMRLVGWTNVATGEVRSPWPDLRVEACRKLAFSGIHLMRPAIFDAFDTLGFGDVFPIMDFYIKACRDYPIYGFAPSDLRLLDVGKLTSLAEAEAFLRS